MLYILDTDHISLLQRRDAKVVANLTRVNIENRAVTIITVTEQVQGRLLVIHQAKTEADVARGLERLYETIRFYTTIQVLPYDINAQTQFEELRRQKIRVGTQDLRIAAITLSRNATLVTRNLRDFMKVPALNIIDWST